MLLFIEILDNVNDFGLVPFFFSKFLHRPGKNIRSLGFTRTPIQQKKPLLLVHHGFTSQRALSISRSIFSIGSADVNNKVLWVNCMFSAFLAASNRKFSSSPGRFWPVRPITSSDFLP